MLSSLVASVRTRLMLLVLLALLPVLGLAFYDRYDQRQRNVHAVQDQALELARRAAVDQRELAGAAYQLLFPLAQLPVVRDEGPTPCNTFFAELLKENRRYTNLGVINPRGDVVCAGVAPASPINLNEHPYLARVLQRQVVIGDSEIGTINDEPTINMAFPIVDDRQQVQGAVFASLDLNWFHAFAVEQKMPESSTLVLVDRTHTLGMRYPDMATLDAHAAANQAAHWFDTPADQHVAEFTDSDGVARLYTFTPFDNGGYVGVGVPSVMAYADVDRDAARDWIILLSVTGFALAAAWFFGDWFIARHLRGLLRTTRQLAAGDLSARTGQSYGSSELSQLAHAFDQMAVTLQQRATGQKQSEEAFRRQAAELAAITQLSREVTSVLDLSPALTSIAHITAELSRSDASGVYVPDADGVLRLAAWHGVSARFSEEINAIGVTSGIGALGRAIVDRQPVQVPDTDVNYDSPFTPAVKAEGIRAILAVPMFHNDKLTGGITLWHRQPRHFTSREVTFLQAIAQQCVNAIENAHLLQAEHEARELAEALRDTAAALSGTLDFDELLDRILDNVGRVVPHDSANIMLIDQGIARVARQRFSARPANFALRQQLKISETANLRQMVETGIACVIEDVQKDSRWTDFPETHWVHSHIGAPIRVKGQVIGFLNLDSTTPCFYTPAHIPRLQAFADQAALALENAHLLQVTHTRAEQLALLYDAGLALNSILEPRAQLEYLLKIAMRALKADCASFFRFNTAHSLVQPETCVGYSEEGKAAFRGLGTTIGDEQSVIGWVATNRLPLNLPEVSADPRYAMIDPRLRSGLWMPVEREQQLLGVFGVLSTQPHAFHVEDERLLALFANQSAVALENARLFGELQSSLQILTHLYQLSSQVLTAATLQETAQLATQILRDSFAASAAWVHLFDSRGTLEFTYGTGSDSIKYGDWTPRPDGLSHQVWSDGRPTIVTDSQLLHPTARASGTQSAIVLPLRGDPVNLGVLFLGYPAPRLFAEREVELLSLFANQVALAIKRVRLTTETHQRIDQLAVLNRIARAVNQTPHLDELLEVIHQEITAILSCDALSIALYDPSAQELDFRIHVDENIRDQPSRRPLGAGLSSQVVLTQKPLHIHDWEKEKNDALNPIPWGTMQIPRTWLGVPMKIGSEVVGVISIQSYRPYAYGYEEEQLLITIADQVAAAIQRVRLFEETQHRLTELEAMNRISTALRVALTSTEMLPLLLDATLAVMNAPSGAAILLDGGPDQTSQTCARGWLRDVITAPLAPEQGITGHVLATGEPYPSPDFRTDSLTPPEMREQIPPGWGGVCLPIRAARRALGVLFVSVQAPRAIQPGEVRLLTTIAEMAGNAIQRATLHEQTERHLHRLNALHTIDTAINGSLDLPLTLRVLLDQVGLQLGADAADVLILNSTTQTLEYAAERGFRTNALAQKRLRLGEGYTTRAILESKIVHLTDLAAVHDDPRAELLAAEGFSAYYAAPLVSKGQFRGVLEIFQRAPLQASDEWLDFLSTLADQTAIAVENATLFTRLQQSNVELALAYDSTIAGWSRALDLRDEETEGHTQRVTEMTQRLARALRSNDSNLVNLRRGALLHDIGKMAIPDHILLKKGTLTTAEMEIMRRHPQYAYEFLSPIRYLRDALDIPYCHHEKWDGTGYPRGLKQEQIPLAARIFAVVDVWDALRSERPYRHAWRDDQVKAYLKAQAGIHFDPHIAEFFLRILEE